MSFGQGERVDGGESNACMYFIEEGEAIATKNVPKPKAASTTTAAAAADCGADAMTTASESGAEAKAEVKAEAEAEAAESFDEVEVGRMRRGQFFGERALITSEPRAANVKAAASSSGNGLRVAALDCAAFERLLGDCREVMRRHAKRQYDGEGGGNGGGGGGGGNDQAAAVAAAGGTSSDQ